MPDNGAVIITGKLDDTELTKSIDKLVDTVDEKLGKAAETFENNIGRMDTALRNFTQGAKNEINEIRTTFSAMGTAFDTLRKAIEKAANAWAASNGTGAGSWSGGTKPPAAPNTIGELKEQIAKQKELLDAERQHTAELQKRVNLLRQMEDSLRRQTTSTEKMRQQAVGMNLRNINSIVPTNITEAENKLNRLKRLLANLNTSVRNLGVNKFDFLPESMWNRIQGSITRTEKQLERLRQQAAKPIMPNDMAGVMGMSEKTLDQIALKMKAISELRAKTPVGSADISRLNGEYARLSKMQSEILGKNASLIESNNSLGRAFNYIKNRLAFTLTIGAFTGFVRQLYEIRGQYELLERSLGVLLDSFSKGSQIFNELNAMAIQSPFTLIELGTAAKQLTAYNFKANEVVDTTRRLADISSALGVPMERLVYNLGQIRAQTVLTARDARDFANAGLAIVPELAKYYTELQGKVVSTADVFDMMKKKAVSYNDVMSVLYKITDEGGKFFDFQAKQAGTLKVQLANLNLAWNNMLNDIGKSNQGLLSFPVQGLRDMFLHWKDISNAITLAVGALGAYKLAQFSISKVVGVSNASLVRSAQAEAKANVTRLQRIQLTRQLTQEEQVELAQSRFLIASKQAMNQADYENMLAKVKLSKIQASQLVTMNKHNIALREALISTGMLTREEAANAMAVGKWSLMFKRAMISLRAFGLALKSILLTPTTGIMLLVTIAADIANTWKEASQAVKEFNNELAKNSKESYDSLSKFLGSYSSSIGKTLSVEEAKKTWEAMREEIIKSSSAGQGFVARLEQIDDVNQRIKEGFNYVSSIQAVHGALQEINDDVIKIQEDWSKWWNFGLGNDSMMENLDQYIEYLKEVGENYEKAIKQGTIAKGHNPFATISDELETLQSNLDETAKSMVNLFTNKNFTPEQEREGFNKVVDEMVSKYNMGVEQSLHFRMQLEKRYQAARLNLYEQENSENSKNLYNAWNKDFGDRQALEDEFLKWMSRNHRSEVQAMFGNMTKEEIAHINWSELKWKQWAINNAQDFSKQYNLSFNDLQYLVNSANRMSIRIPVFFDFVNTPKSIYDTLTEADQAANSAYQKYQRLQERLNQLRSQGKQKTKEYTDTEKEATDALKEYNEALAKGGKSKSAEASASKRANAANKANAKARREQAKAESELQKALKDELQVIEKVQAAYKKLTKAGVSRDEALSISTSGFENTAKNINNVLKKYGIAQFDIKKFAGLSNPREMLKMLEEQLAKIKASGKSKPVEIKEFEAQINKIRVDAKEYDMKLITDGLNNELGKIKEEYELAVELDANPELGSIFADMMGISKEEIENLPKDYAQVMRKLQSIIDQNIGGGVFNLSENLNKASFDQWVKERGNELDDGFAKALDDIREYANKVRLDETKQITQDWDKLLEKYAEYEHKRIQIIEESERELETARKHGASADIVDAIINKKKQELAKLNFEEFQKSSIWITATGDLSKLSNQALQILIDRLVEFKRENKDLDPKQIQKINKALRQMRKEQAKDNPFKALSIAMLEAEERAEEIQIQMDDLQAKIYQMQAEEQDSTIINPENQKILQEMKEELVRLGILKEEVLEIPFADKGKTIGAYVKAFKAVADSFKQIADSTNDFNLKQTADAISDVIGNFEAAEQGAQTWGGWWGAIIGGVTDAIPKIFKWVSGNAKIDYDIQQSQIQVKKLTNFYKDLEAAANKAYGVEAYGAQKAMLSNKEFQLEALKAQLRLEKSRKKKYQDQSAIADLEGQIIDLKNEINEATENIVNDLLGITSKADFAENLVSSMIDAFKNGEDYMKVFEESFEDMVDNMIMKAIVSRLVGDWINSIWDKVNAKAAESDTAKSAEIDMKNAEQKMKGFVDVDEDLYKFWKKKYEEALAAYNAAITPTPEDIAGMREFFEQGRDDFKNNFLAYMDAFGIKFGEGAGKADLSALQQGITNISETTAESLEAYMNSVSQQVYYQSDILTQIRDILVNFGGDITIATNAQILFELQQSTQIQMSIQSILQGWSNASGLAVRVELAN